MAASRTQTHNGITWTDIGGPTKSELDRLAKDYVFHPIHLEESTLIGHLPQIEREKEYLFILLQVPAIHTKTIVSDQLAIFLGHDYLVTIHKEPTDEIRTLFNACETGHVDTEEYFKHSSSRLLLKILTDIFSKAGDSVQDILEELDDIEDTVFDEKATASYEIGRLRQKITKLKRLTDLLQDVLSDLPASISAFANEELGRYYRSLAKRTKRLAVVLAEAETTIEIFKDADFTASSARTNQVLAVLTIIFTLTIPATLLGTFYGMNIPLPGGIEAGAWTFWGPFTTLALVLVSSFILALVMAWYFWRKKWF